MNLFDLIEAETEALAYAAGGPGIAAVLKRAAGGQSTSFRVVFGDHQSVVTETDRGAVSEVQAQVFAPRSKLLAANSNTDPQPGDTLSVTAAASPFDAGEWRVRAVERDPGAFVLSVVRITPRIQRGGGAP